jgi:hypothetical protein
MTFLHGSLRSSNAKDEYPIEAGRRLDPRLVQVCDMLIEWSAP